MHVQSVIEIAPTDGLLPVAVIIRAYRSSQYGLVIFILNNVTPAAINLVLDPVVNTLPLSIPGVLYVQISDETRVRQAVTSAQTVYVATEAFHDLAVGYGAAPGIVRPIGPPPRSCAKKRVNLVNQIETRGQPKVRRRPAKVVLYQAHHAHSFDIRIGRA